MRLFVFPFLVLALASLGACDSAPGPAQANSSKDPLVPVQIGNLAFGEHRLSYDWNFRLENLHPDVPVTFRRIALADHKEAVETSRIVMTREPDSTYAFTGAWPGYDHPNAKVHAVVTDASGGLSVLGPFNALGDGPQKTDDPVRSYHVGADGQISLDYIDTDDGLLPTPTTAFIPSAGSGGTIIHNVAYLVYVPKGNPLDADIDDVLVRVFGSRQTQVVTESIGSDELPQIVYDLFSTGS